MAISESLRKIEMDTAELRELAARGDARAIAAFLAQNVLLSDVSIKAKVEGNSLHLLLETAYVPEQAALVEIVEAAVRSLDLATIQTLYIYGRQVGMQTPPWKANLSFSDGATPNTQISPASLPQSQTINQTASHPYIASRAPTTQLPKHPSKRREPFVLTVQDLLNLLKKFDPLKLGFITCLAVYGLFGAQNYTVAGFLYPTDQLMTFIHGANLIFHEAGHIFFMVLGQFIGVLGGSLFQILVPAGITAYFVVTRQFFAAAVALCWTGQNFWDVSIYVKDAQSLALPLLGGENGFHDWNFLLNELGLLTQDQLVGNVIFWFGWLLYAGAIAAGFYFARTPTKPAPKLENLK